MLIRDIWLPALTIPLLEVCAASSAWAQPPTRLQSATAAPATVSMTIQVHVPANTPAGDTVWITGGFPFAPTGIGAMSPLAVTSNTWQATISAPAGTIVRYSYNRNSNPNQQEAYVPFDAGPGNGNYNYRELVMTNGATVVDTVAQWVDTPLLNNSIGTLTGTVTDQSGNPLMGIWVSAGPHQRMTFSDGSFLIEGVPAGPSTVTFSSGDSEYGPIYGPITVTTTIPPGGTATQNMALPLKATSTVTFNVTVPGDTPAGAVPRLLGDTYPLGWVPPFGFAGLDTTRLIDMTHVGGSLWNYTAQLGNGTCVNYLYTLGFLDLNNERDNNGNSVNRSLCANGVTTVNDTVATWKSPQQVPISLAATSPTGADDTLYVYPQPQGLAYPTKMWSTGTGTAAYTIYADPSTTQNYNYIRNGDVNIGVEIVGSDTNPPTQRKIATGASGAASNDTIVWRDQMREPALSTVTSDITGRFVPRSSPFQTGVELIDYWRTAWLPLVAPTLARIKSMNAQWVQIASYWSCVDVVNPTIEQVLGSFPTQDLVTHIRVAKAAGLNVALNVEPFPNNFPGPHSTAWYDQFFSQITLMELYHAKIAQQEGVGLIILSGLSFGVDSQGGPPSTYINAKWKSVVAAIRASGYTGKLTSDEVPSLPEFDWPGDLDYLGGTWFWPVATTDSDTVLSMYNSAINILTSHYLPIEARFHKPFIFQSVAYYSADTSAMQLYSIDTTGGSGSATSSPQISDFLPPDPSVASAYNQQAQAYRAVLLAFAATPWVQGCYSFGYAYFNFDSKGYSIRDKTAENIMSQIYQQINANPSSTSPVILSVDTAGGDPNIAENGWIEIKGTNLAPASVGPNGMTWSNAPEFASGTMPTQLDGVSVTVNGKPAFVYYISTSQVNVLTPLDNTTGPVPVVVTIGGVSSVPYYVNMEADAPSFLLIDSSEYIVATHADYSLVGPASLSVPGYPFTPAQPGETIVLYGVGFGPPKTALVDGSSSQSGPLPTLPEIKIGGVPATVTYAGLTSPGLYQFNVVVPNGAANGDNVVTCSYNGQSTPAGDLITVQQ